MSPSAGPLAADGPCIFLIAGEPSGDALGARLMAALAARTGGAARFVGIGGPLMMAQGLTSLFPMTDLANFGVFEVAPRIPLLLRRMRETAAAIRAHAPDAVVSIDVPGFCFGVWRRLRGAGFPLIHYVAPTVWAWRPWRVHKFKRHLDHLMTLLPFEPPYFARVGLAASFVGHPVLECGADRGDAARCRARHGIGQGPLVCVLPGSRQGEVARHLGPFGAAIASLARRHPHLTAIVPTLPELAPAVAAAVARWPCRTILVRDDAAKFDAMAACDVALAASGTVALELALAGAPMVVAYRLAPITYAIAKLMVRVDYVTLINLLLDRPAVPELLQSQCRGDPLAAALERLLDDAPARAAQIAAGRAVLALLRAGDRAPSDCAAETVLGLIAQRKGPQP